MVQMSLPVKYHGIHGAMVTRLTPDQKVACLIHVGFEYHTIGAMVARLTLDQKVVELGFKYHTI